MSGSLIKTGQAIILLVNRGEKGDPGDGSVGVGTQGPQGVQGIPGIQGIQGIPSVKGDTGSQGIQGIPGVKGDTGRQGIQGIPGVKGDTGSQGIKGDTGDQGIQGIQGVPGASGVSGLGLLVYAEQNTDSPLSSYVSTIVPFDTEVSDPLNLFASGFFTPAVNGIYRVDTFLALNGSSAQGRHYIELWTASSKVLTLFTNDTYVSYTADAYRATLPLTAGTAYCIKVYSGATDPVVVVGAGVKNTLSIERLI